MSNLLTSSTGCSPSHHLPGQRLRQRALGAGGIDLPTALGERSDNLVDLAFPLVARHVAGAKGTKLAEQQDQTQNVAEDDSFLLLQLLAGDILVERAVEFQEFARRPNAVRAELACAGILIIKQQSQLVGERENALALFGEQTTARFVLGGRGVNQLVGAGQSQLQQFRM